jgi:C4-dicarboxylate-specific signal transduction histidine kinase
MFRSVTLRDFIYKSYLTSSLIPIFVIELVLIVLYFGVSYFITHESQNTLYSSASQSLHEITTREAQQISHQFQEVSRIATMMQQDHQEYFVHQENCTLVNTMPEFTLHKNGAYFKTQDNGGSSLYYGADTQMTPQTKRKALCSEAMDPLLKSIVDTNPIVTQAYFNSWDGMNRLYPFMPDAPGQYGASITMQDYNFYYLADKTHNPEKKPVWTSAYLDPAGQGWMITSAVPIYNKEFLEGVSGLDVTIDSLIQNILSLNIPWNGSAFLVDADGMILAMPEKVESILGLKELKEHLYESNIQKTIQKPEEYNLFKIKNSALQKQMSAFFESFKQFESIKIDKVDYLISQERIPETGWRLIVLVDESMIYEPINTLKKKTDWIGYIAIALMATFYLLFFSYLLRKSSRIASKIASPIQELSLLTSDLGNKPDNFIDKKVGIKEVDRLSENFNKVSMELDARTKEYVEAQLREKMREKDTEIAYKTGLFESASSYLHNIGNTLTMIDSKILSLRDLKNALEKSTLGFTKLLDFVKNSDANATQQEEISRFIESFNKALTKDVTKEIETIANSIESINRHASVSIHHQQDLFNASTDMKQNYTQEVDVTNMLEELAQDYRASFTKKRVNIHLHCDDILTLNTIKFQFHSGLSNVFKNALESIAMHPSIEMGEISVRAFRNKENKIFIKIEDNGVGILSEHKPKLLQSGFTTKENGHGLGLHSFNNFLNSHHGKLTLYSLGYLQGAIVYIEIGDDDAE